MKIRIFLIFILLILLIPLWSWLAWRYQPGRVLNTLIIDKTVVNLQRNEHRSLNWVLTHDNYLRPDSNLYSIEEDYYGFFPLLPLEDKEFRIDDLDKFTEPQLDSIANMLDLFYYADGYGIYRNEWYLDTLETEHSPKIYGGMSEKELYLIEKMKQQQKLIITEFNTFASPTYRYLRKRMEEMFGLQWSGWTGRYFHVLDKEVNLELPNWVVNLYEKHYQRDWHFKKSGIVLVHEDTRIIILENETSLAIETPMIYTDLLGREKFGLPEKVHYPFWFDITYAGPCNSVISRYKIHTNSHGDSLLKAFEVPGEFPAVIEHTNPYPFYYFAGDYADNPLKYNSTYFKGITYIDFMFYNENMNDRTKFFWKFYQPLVSKIIENYWLEINEPPY